MTTKENGFPIDIRLDDSTQDYGLMTEAERETFLKAYEEAMTEEGFEVNARWQGGVNYTSVDGVDTYRRYIIDEDYPGILDAMDRVYDIALQSLGTPSA